jgi:protein phosphatase
MPGARTVIDYAGASVTGRHREVNEDAWGAIESASVFIVADGGGGEASGRLAADLAVTSFRRFFSGQRAGFATHAKPPPNADPLLTAVLEANAQIATHAVGDSEGISCTLVALRLAPPWLVVLSVGDCRLYRYRRGYDPQMYSTADARGGELRRMTVDDLLAVEAWRTGATFEQCAEVDRTHPHVITRVLGLRPDVDVSIGYYPLVPNDLYLLCSDGVTRQLDDNTIREIVSNDEEALADRCDALVQTADQRSGVDNVTAVLLNVMA